jgi:type IV pilus assembly protein PilE
MEGNHRPTKARRSAGFTLIELLLIVAILGIIGAVGLPIYTGYLQGAKESAAQNNLRSIYLMEQDYYNENSTYCTTQSSKPCNSAATINQNLFGGKKNLDESATSPYLYRITGSGSGYRALATRRDAGTSLQQFYIDQNNSLVKF